MLRHTGRPGTTFQFHSTLASVICARQKKIARDSSSAAHKIFDRTRIMVSNPITFFNHLIFSLLAYHLCPSLTYYWLDSLLHATKLIYIQYFCNSEAQNARVSKHSKLIIIIIIKIQARCCRTSVQIDFSDKKTKKTNYMVWDRIWWLDAKKKFQARCCRTSVQVDFSDRKTNYMVWDRIWWFVAMMSLGLNLCFQGKLAVAWLSRKQIAPVKFSYENVIATKMDGPLQSLKKRTFYWEIGKLEVVLGWSLSWHHAKT